MEQISNSHLINDVDIAVAAWHEDGRWTLALLPDAHDLAQIIDRLKSQQTNGGAIALIAIDEEIMMLGESKRDELGDELHKMEHSKKAIKAYTL